MGPLQRIRRRLRHGLRSSARVADGAVAAADEALLRHSLGLDRPLLVQYGDWLQGVVGAANPVLRVSAASGAGITDLIGRIENVHFNPWFSMKPKLFEWQLANGEAFIFGRSDWEYVLNTFCFGYGVGYKFADR